VPDSTFHAALSSSGRPAARDRLAVRLAVLCSGTACSEPRGPADGPQLPRPRRRGAGVGVDDVHDGRPSRHFCHAGQTGSAARSTTRSRAFGARIRQAGLCPLRACERASCG
jgi:hypothetical protein